jgi:acetylornithine/succinyldiaminopimelate/putrescine aminotransferase/predicted amino acid dehydrogenase
MNKFGFIAHPMNYEEFQFLKLMNHTQNFIDLKGSFQCLNNIMEEAGTIGRFIGKKSNGITFLEIDCISTEHGRTSGIICCLPVMPKDILEDQAKSFLQIKEIAEDLINEHKVDIIGLGGFTGIIGNRGKDLNEIFDIPFTTGNIFTAYNGIAALDHLRECYDLVIEDLPVTIIGFPGSIATLIAEVLAKRSEGKQKLVLVGRGTDKYLRKMIEESKYLGDNVTVINNITDALDQGKIIITATSSGGIIDISNLSSGSIVIDIAAPRDVIKPLIKREDVLVIDGGRCGFNETVSWNDNIFTSFIKNNLYGCILETVLLALDDRLEPFSVGRTLSVQNLEEIAPMSKKHGFVITNLYSFNENIDESKIRSFIKRYFPSNKIITNLNDFHNAKEQNLKEVMDKYKSYISPTIADLWNMADFARLFVRGDGIKLWDRDGEMYYDFVAGYGSVNFGHNNPTIISGIKEMLDMQIPSIVQISPTLITSALAENIAQLLPGDLEVSFFCNSGTEAIEAAIKLVKKVSTKKYIVSAIGSFHGKSLGSLSISGKEKYKKYYRPLLKHTVNIPFGDIEAAEEVFKGKDVAAFFVEPVQGEGGVVIPPVGYLKELRGLCDKYDVLLVVDEIQTGFGRTGKNFAVEHDNIVPDIMTISKSLGGGILPIGACVTSKFLFKKAYGKSENYALHTSTFGGNNFTATAAIQATKLLIDGDFAEKAKNKGAYFKSRLLELSKKYPIIKEVRAIGLMIGIEFEMDYNGGLDEMKSQIESYLNDEFDDMSNLLSDDLYKTINRFTNGITGNIESYMQKNFTLMISSYLLKDFKILTFSTLNNPNVIRIQPPLVITEEEIDYFIHGFEQVLKKFSFIYETSNSFISV